MPLVVCVHVFPPSAVISRSSPSTIRKPPHACTPLVTESSSSQHLPHEPGTVEARAKCPVKAPCFEVQPQTAQVRYPSHEHKSPSRFPTSLSDSGVVWVTVDSEVCASLPYRGVADVASAQVIRYSMVVSWITCFGGQPLSHSARP